jgi:hypothetical protein
MLEKIKAWWKATGQEAVGTFAVAVTVLVIIYSMITGIHWVAVTILGLTGLTSVVKAIVVFSISYTVVLLYFEWRDFKEDPNDITNLFHDNYW